MVKVIIHITKVVVAAILTLLCVSCGFERVNGSGNVVTQNRNITEEFTAVAASSGIDVVIEQGNERAVIVEADDNLQEHIKTDVRGKELKVSSDVSIGRSGSKKVIVKLPVIESIEASSGSSVKSRNTLKNSSMALSTSSGSSMEVIISSKDATCKSSSGSGLTVSGKADKLKTDSSSGSTINAKELNANNVTAEASSGSTTYINPVKSLSAKASSGSTVKYMRTPDKLDKKVSSGGSVLQD
mgnify:CR=1 FL=1